MPRTPPSAEQITEVLRRAYSDLDERAIPWVDAKRILAKELHTTHAKADEWLRDAALDAPDLWWAMATSNGALLSVLQRHQGSTKLQRVALREPEAHLPIETTRDWTHVSLSGRYEPEKERSRRPFTLRTTGNDDIWYLVTTKGLQHLLDAEAREAEEMSLRMQGKEVVSEFTFESHHPRAADYLRGLLHVAGITEDGTRNQVTTYASENVGPHGRPYTSLEMSVAGPQIDLLTEALQRLGIPAIPKE